MLVLDGVRVAGMVDAILMLVLVLVMAWIVCLCYRASVLVLPRWSLVFATRHKKYVHNSRLSVWSVT